MISPNLCIQAMKILSKKKLKRKAGLFGRALPKRKAPGGADRKISESPLIKVSSEFRYQGCHILYTPFSTTIRCTARSQS